MFRLVNNKVWSKVGHFSKALSKGPKTTTWIWNLHAEAHDFETQSTASWLLGRKVFSANLAHLSVVFFWLSGMLVHGAYLSNYGSWIKEPIHCVPSAQLAWSVVGQEILNGDVGYYYQGIAITSGLFNVWRSQGMIHKTQLKSAAAVSMIGTLVSLIGSYFHMHVGILKQGLTHLATRFRAITSHHLFLVLGLGSISWSGHQVHISIPIDMMLSAGIDPLFIPSAQDFLFGNHMRSVFPGFGTHPFVDFSWASSDSYLNQCCFVQVYNLASHHFYIGVLFIFLGLWSQFSYPTRSIAGYLVFNSLHWVLALNLAISGSLSLLFAMSLYSLPVYPYLACDYASMVSCFTHHMWIGCFLIVGAGAHMAIYFVRESLSSGILNKILIHRDVIISHLFWISLLLGFHSFGIYIHNDTMQALSRGEDVFADNCIQIKPFIGSALNQLFFRDMGMLDGKLYFNAQPMGTSDFMLHHIHAFTLHVTVLILLKGVIYSRSSRLVSDKVTLGFRFPCDGPGRGGTCQISSWDHIYLAGFWSYNCISVVIFHYYWKLESDVWGFYDETTNRLSHLTNSDFSVHANTINGWLRSFLWAQSSTVIQSYGLSISAYGLIFVGSHFVWALSLMFLFSGRGYWQELIESILWCHNKLYVYPSIQPRALSIIQGRAVGLSHYLLGGIGCTWSFFLSRLV